MCWTSFQTRRRGTTIVIGICIGAGGSTSGRRRCASGRRCVSSLRLGGAGSLSGRRRLTNCCSVFQSQEAVLLLDGSVLGLRNPQAPEHERRLCYPSVVAIRPWRRIWGLGVHWGPCPSGARRRGRFGGFPGPGPGRQVPAGRIDICTGIILTAAPKWAAYPRPRRSRRVGRARASALPA